MQAANTKKATEFPGTLGVVAIGQAPVRNVSSKIPLASERRSGLESQSMSKTRLLAVVIGLLLVIGLVAVAQPPERDISHHHHPNLAAAQDLSHRAWQKVLDAQKANEWDMDGHAQKAKELLDQVNEELRKAANAANRNR
jgi:hypothetical protein